MIPCQLRITPTQSIQRWTRARYDANTCSSARHTTSAVTTKVTKTLRCRETAAKSVESTDDEHPNVLYMESDTSLSSQRLPRLSDSGDAHKFRITNALKMYGSGGALAYGFLNAIFYGFGIAFVWIFICKIPLGLSVDEFFHALAKVATYTWAFSQITKGARGFAAVALANPMNGVIQCVSRHFNLSFKTIFLTLVSLCFCFVFTIIVLLAMCRNFSRYGSYMTHRHFAK